MKGFIVLIGFLIPMLSFAQCDSFDGTLSVNVTGFTSSAGYTQEYAIVDNTGTILEINGTGAFAGLADGSYTVYAVNYEGLTPAVLASGLLWSNVDSFDQNSANCFHSISNNYTVCSNTQLCNGDDIVVTTSNYTMTAGYQQIYVLIDLGTGNIVASNTTGTFNQGNYGGIGNYQVYVVNTNDAGVVALLTGNGAWSAALTAISTNCADLIGPKNFNIINCCDLIISGTVSNETCTGNDGSISLTITGSATYDVTINGVLYTPLNDVTANTYAIPNLSDGTYQVIVFDINDNLCDDTLDLVILDGGQTYNLNENISACINTTVNYPDGTSEVIIGNTTNTSNLTTAQGCDSIIVTTVTAASLITNTINETVCFGTQYTSPQGNNYSAGTFNETLVSASGCDSVVTYNVTELAAISNSVNETVCFGAQYTSPQGNNYSVGTFNETLVSVFGCDSVVTYNVTELAAITNTVNETVCFGAQYTSPQGNNYSVGTFNETFVSDSGCDSVVTYNVTELAAITNTVNEIVCFGAQYTSPQGNNYSTGSFNETLISASSCDSIVTYIITELAAITSILNVDICIGTQYTSPQGNNYSAGTFDETFVTASGCDSVVTYNVSELITLTSTFNSTVCFGDQFTSPQGNNYGVGSFDETFTSSLGCDSIVTFIIAEIPAITNTIFADVCFGELYTSPQGNNYGAGSFDEIFVSGSGCDSTVTYNITELDAIAKDVFEIVCFGALFTSPQGNDYGGGAFDETYVSASGCDSVVTFNVTELAPLLSNVNELVCFGSQFTSPQGNTYGVGSFDEVYISVSGCDSTVTFIINEIPSITSNTNEVVCFGEQFTSPQGNNYSAGNFDEVYTSTLGCDSIVTFNITELPAISSTSFQSVCFGEEYISPNGTVYPAGTFTEILTASNGCDSAVILVISEFDLVVAGFNSDFYGLTSLNTEASFINTSLGSESYIWNFGDGSPFSSEESPIHDFPEFEAGEYTITLIAINATGCSDTITQSIIVQEELIFYVPNAFTPDGDEFNQTFQPVFNSGFDPFDYSLLIFNRWGEVIFESHDTTIGWDGTYNGKYAQDGSYTWKIEFKEITSDKRRMEIGHVNMLR
jgi:gliding motility-associated-like protein